MTNRAWAIAVAASLLTACAHHPPAPTAPPNLKGEVAAFLDGYFAAVGSRDEAKIRQSYVADDRFAWVEDGKVRYRRVEDVLTSLASFPPGTPIRTELSDLAVAPVGNSGAHAWASFRTTVGAGSSAFSFGGAITLVLERDANRWRVVGGHTSSPSRR